MAEFLGRCDCRTLLLKHGRGVVAGGTPTHGQTLYCPTCGTPRPWDSVRVLTDCVHAFSADGTYLGRIEAGVQPEQVSEPVPSGGLESVLERCKQCRAPIVKFGRRIEPAPPPDKVRDDAKMYRCAQCGVYHFDPHDFASTRIHLFQLYGRYVCEVR